MKRLLIILTILVAGVVSSQDSSITDANPEVAFDFKCGISNRQERIEALENLSYGYVTVTHTVNTYEGYRVEESVSSTGTSRNLSTVTPTIKIENLLEGDLEILKAQIKGWVNYYQKAARNAKFNALAINGEIAIATADLNTLAIPTHSVTVTIFKGANTTPETFYAVDYGNEGNLGLMTIEDFNTYYNTITTYINNN